MRLLLFAVLAAMPACLPVPYVIAPLRVRAGGGVLVDEGGAASATRALPTADLTVGVHPGQWFDEHGVRPLDLGLQYRLEHSAAGTRHGAALEGSWLVPLSATRSWRLVPRAGLDFIRRIDAWGAGATAGLGVEYAGWVEGVDQGSDARFGAGVRRGEAAIGLDLAATYRRFPGMNDWGVTLGLTFRLPALAGFTAIWIWDVLGMALRTDPVGGSGRRR